MLDYFFNITIFLFEQTIEIYPSFGKLYPSTLLERMSYWAFQLTSLIRLTLWFSQYNKVRTSTDKRNILFGQTVAVTIKINELPRHILFFISFSSFSQLCRFSQLEIEFSLSEHLLFGWLGENKLLIMLSDNCYIRLKILPSKPTDICLFKKYRTRKIYVL